MIAGSANAATLTVCKIGCAYSSIQAAINASSSGDTILVQSGTYAEEITLEGFTVTGSGDFWSDAGIKITSNNNTLIGNNASNNYFSNTKNVFSGGSSLGGNVWANPNGTGFSQTCEDADIDYLPLAYPCKPPTNPTVIINLSGIIWINQPIPCFYF